MIPHTELLRTLIACFYAIYVEEMPKRRVQALQRRLRTLVDTIQESRRSPLADLGKSVFQSGVIGSFQQVKPASPCNGRVYPKLVVQNGLSQIEARMAPYWSAAPSGVHPPVGRTMHRAVKSRQVAKNVSFGALYGGKPRGLGNGSQFLQVQSDDSDDEVLRRARYELYYVEGDEERLTEIYELVKQRFPLDALMLDLA